MAKPCLQQTYSLKGFVYMVMRCLAGLLEVMTMKILAFGDWRIQPLDMIVDLVKSHKPDVILYAGDDIDRFVRLDKPLLLKTTSYFWRLNYPATQKFKRLLKEIIGEIPFQTNDILPKLGIPFYYVNGNDDFVLYTDGTYYTRIHNGRFFIDGKCYVIAETPEGKITIKEMDTLPFLFANESEFDPRGGIYAPMSPSFGKFTIRKKGEEITIFGVECEFGLGSEIKNEPREYTDIYLSHLPPLGTLDLSVRFGMDHIGSKRLLEAIEEYHPRLVICGHSHIWGGITGKIEDTLVINVSSQDRDPSYGNYALIDTDDWSVEMNTVQKKTMRTIRGISTIKGKLKRKRIDLLKSDESSTIEEITKALRSLSPYSPRTLEEPSDTMEKIEKLGIDIERVKKRVESLKWKKPKIIRRITINPDKPAFVDVETGLAKGPEPGELWLIGVWYMGDLRQFLFPEEKEEFFEYLRQNQITSLASWTRYDSSALRSILAEANIEIKFVDACQRTSNCVIWHTYSLHELYDALFPDRSGTVNLIPGYIAGLYADHLIISKRSCPYCPPKEMIMAKIKERNRIDILQMIEICRRLWYI